jgi:hypothetical protein
MEQVGVRWVQLEEGTQGWCHTCVLPSTVVVRWLLLRERLVRGAPPQLLGCSVVATECCMDCGQNRYVDLPGGTR